MTNLEIIKFVKERKQFSSEEVARQLLHHHAHSDMSYIDAIDLVETMRECLP